MNKLSYNKREPQFREMLSNYCKSEGALTLPNGDEISVVRVEGYPVIGSNGFKVEFSNGGTGIVSYGDLLLWLFQRGPV